MMETGFCLAWASNVDTFFSFDSFHNLFCFHSIIVRDLKSWKWSNHHWISENAFQKLVEQYTVELHLKYIILHSLSTHFSIEGLTGKKLLMLQWHAKQYYHLIRPLKLGNLEGYNCRMVLVATAWWENCKYFKIDDNYGEIHGSHP